MNVQLCILYPRNWTGVNSQITRATAANGSSILELQIEKLQSIDANILATVLRPAETESQVLEEIQSILIRYGVNYLILDDDIGDSAVVQTIFDSQPAWNEYMKVLVEDFFAPSAYALESYQNELNESECVHYSFSINESPGMDFEIYHRSICSPLQKLENKSRLLLKYRIAKIEHQAFQRRRYRRQFVNEFIPNFRFTIDSAESQSALKQFMCDQGLNSLLEIQLSEFKQFAKQVKAFERIFPNQFYNHREDYQSDIEVPQKMQFLERGLVCKKYMNGDSKVLDLCSGDMFLPQICYSQSASEIHCVDNSVTSQEIYSRYELEQSGIRLHSHSILDDSGWDEISKLGPFDVVTFTQAIEHFTIEEQTYIARKIASVLKDGGVVAGDTILVPKESLPGHWQHKNEFASEQQLSEIFEPFFQKVEVFISYYKEINDQPLYFVCQK